MIPGSGGSPKKEWLPTSVFLPREFHGQRSLAGYSPWDHKESSMTEATQHACVHTHTHPVNTVAIAADGKIL